VNVFVPVEVVELANAPLGVHLFVTVGTPATDWDSNSSAGIVRVRGRDSAGRCAGNGAGGLGLTVPNLVVAV